MAAEVLFGPQRAAEPSEAAGALAALDAALGRRDPRTSLRRPRAGPARARARVGGDRSRGPPRGHGGDRPLRRVLRSRGVDPGGDAGPAVRPRGRPRAAAWHARRRRGGRAGPGPGSRCALGAGGEGPGGGGADPRRARRGAHLDRSRGSRRARGRDGPARRRDPPCWQAGGVRAPPVPGARPGRRSRRGGARVRPHPAGARRSTVSPTSRGGSRRWAGVSSSTRACPAAA